MMAGKSFSFRFADVEVREREFSLIKAGEILPVEPKAFRVLLILLRNPQKLLPKDELLTAVWGDTAVSENSLARSIALLRRLLGDEARDSRFIETVATVGYRFVCPVEVSEVDEENPPVPRDGRGKRNLMWFLTGTAVLVTSLSATIWYLRRPLPPPRITAYVQITHDGHEKQLAGTDGSRLYFTLFFPFAIAQVGITGGEIQPMQITAPDGSSYLWDVSPDGSNFLIASTATGHTLTPIWNVRALGGSARRLGQAEDAAYSPDGNSVVYCTGEGDLWLVRSDGSGAQKLASLGARAFSFGWSPDGRRIRFFKDDAPGIWEISSAGSGLHRWMPGWRGLGGVCCGRWTPDGKFYLFLSGGGGSAATQIWAADERRGILRTPATAPVQLTTGPIAWGNLIPAKDGHHIYAQGSITRGELVRLDERTGQFQPFLGGISAEFVSFSPDGRFVAYVSYPEGVLWRAKRDGSDRTQLTEPPIYPANPHWSPDGKEILFMDEAQTVAVGYIVPSEGGGPQRLLPGNNEAQADPTWSPDGRRIVFATGDGRDKKPENLSILDRVSHAVTPIPGSAGVWSPRWSPDGRHIAALSWNPPALRLFDTATQKWSALPVEGSVDYPAWSRDGQSLFYLRLTNPGGGIYRIRIAGGGAVIVAALREDWRMTGLYNFSMSLDPDDTPIVLRDVGSTDIYALTLEEK
jgi:Tol biopolymer transport system component/DNA-binding winged helix-turn-helix (wHTH) protein